CNTARVFTTRSAEDKAALLTATVVNSGDSRFAELDGSTCQPATILFRRQSRRSDGPWSITVAGALLAVTGLAVGAAMAERERLPIVARTREGRRLAMTNGVKLGPPFKLTDHQRKLAAKRMAAGESTRQIARDFNVSHNTIARLR